MDIVRKYWAIVLIAGGMIAYSSHLHAMWQMPEELEVAKRESYAQVEETSDNLNQFVLEQKEVNARQQAVLEGQQDLTELLTTVIFQRGKDVG